MTTPDPRARTERPLTVLESWLTAPRTPLAVLLVVLPALAWLWITVMARDMYGPMTGASAWMMTRDWDWPRLALLWAMWAVMMAAMMLPSATPFMLLYGGLSRRADGMASTLHLYALASGYLIVWIGFSLGATALQRLLATTEILSPMMEVTSAWAGAALLFVAGAYQLTPAKRVCLRHCQSPLGFLLNHWRSSTWGAFRMGMSHGAYCVGCCWALMLLLFVGGVMNLTVILALTALVAVEKLLPLGVHGAHAIGVVLMAAAIWLMMI